MGTDSSKTRNEFENDLFAGATDNILVSDVLEPVSEDVLIDQIITFLDYKDQILLTSVCRYFFEVFHNMTEEIPIYARARGKQYNEGKWPEYKYTETKKKYDKYLSGASKKFKSFRNVESVKLQNLGSLYCFHHNIKIFQKLPIKKLDLEKANIHYVVGRWSKASEDPVRFDHQLVLKETLISLSSTLEYLNLTNYQGDGGNLFLKECFQKCQRLNYLLVGSIERIAKSRRVPIIFDDNPEEIEKANRSLDTWSLTVAFTFARHTKYRPKFDISIFDPLLHPSRIGKLKGLVLFDCSVYPADKGDIKRDNFTHKFSILQKILTHKGERETPLIDIGLTDRHLVQPITKWAMSQVSGQPQAPHIDPKMLETLERAIIWDINNFYKLDEFCRSLKVFEGMLRDDQIERLANQNHATLHTFTLLEKIHFTPEQHAERRRQLRDHEVDMTSNWHNSDKGLIHLQKCTKLRKIEILMPEGGNRKLLRSGFGEEFMVRKKSIVPKKYHHFIIRTQDVFGGGMYPSKVGKVWVTDLRRKDEFYFCWHCEKENYSHSYGKNEEL